MIILIRLAMGLLIVIPGALVPKRDTFYVTDGSLMFFLVLWHDRHKQNIDEFFKIYAKLIDFWGS